MLNSWIELWHCFNFFSLPSWRRIKRKHLFSWGSCLLRSNFKLLELGSNSLAKNRTKFHFARKLLGLNCLPKIGSTRNLKISSSKEIEFQWDDEIRKDTYAEDVAQLPTDILVKLSNLFLAKLPSGQNMRSKSGNWAGAQKLSDGSREISHVKMIISFAGNDTLSPFVILFVFSFSTMKFEIS